MLKCVPWKLIFIVGIFINLFLLLTVGTGLPIAGITLCMFGLLVQRSDLTATSWFCVITQLVLMLGVLIYV